MAVNRSNAQFVSIVWGVFIFIEQANIVYCQLSCNSLTTCGSCIAYPHEICVWCPANLHNETSRCQSRSFSDENKLWCNDTVVDIASSVYYTNNDTLSNVKEKVVQVTPQKMTVDARPGVPVSFDVLYQPAFDYPLDLYYLVDYSFTMKRFKNLLEENFEKIHTQLSKISNNVRLGVGSFVEKPGLPYSDPNYLVYTYKNHLKLTNDKALFKNVFSDSPFGSNFDDPEAALDAMMQAMVCKEDVGWNNKSRKIIILSTDNTYHSAGDGKIIGAYIPNDMKCHMTANGFHNRAASQTYDYPSVSQISNVAKQETIHTIFSVTENVQREYMYLAERIHNAKVTVLKNDSDIVEDIKKEYMELLQNTRMDLKVPEYMTLTLDPPCENNCGIGYHQILNMTATLEIKYCPEDNRQTDIVKITPMGLTESLEITVNIKCQCDCEKNEAKYNSKLCNDRGSYQCGICICNENSYGDDCGCTGVDNRNSDKCKAQQNDTEYCSGRGTCRCGKCECQDSMGQYCEFANDDCRRSDNKLCAGNGKCSYGKCACNSGWAGEACECRDSKACIAQYSHVICSGNGQCVCGKCECNETFSGAFCDECQHCDVERCKELEVYARCSYLTNKTLCDREHNATSETDVRKLDRAEINSGEWHQARRCTTPLGDDDSVLVFKHIYKNKRLTLLIQNELEEPPKVNYWVVIGSAIGTILLVGLLTLIAWKFLVDYYDSKEYEKFYKESKAAGFDVTHNPIYKEPAVNFTNPAYRDT